MSELNDLVRAAAEKNDSASLATLDRDQLEKLKLAEEILEARFQSKRRANRIATLSAAMVGYVALAGFFANAWQVYNSKKHLQEQSERDQQKWQQEFERARAADKYRAFFETSSLVTDQSNSDRRLIGYALLEEFVADRDYHAKARTILVESLSRELAQVGDTEADPLDTHHIAIRQIVSSLAATSDCDDLVTAARASDRLLHHARSEDSGDSDQVFTLFIRRVVGRAALVCRSFADFAAVREPIRASLAKVPWLLGVPKTPPGPDLNAAVANRLVRACTDEMAETATSDCPAIELHYDDLCRKVEQDGAAWGEEKEACEAIRTDSARRR
jgi:hypothetical protein